MLFAQLLQVRKLNQVVNMQKIVEEVLAAEEKAKTLLENARQEATRLKNSVEQEMADKIKTAREQAQEFIKEGIRKTRETANAEYEKIITETEKANALFMTENAEKIEALVKKVSEIIITPEFYRD